VPLQIKFLELLELKRRPYTSLRQKTLLCLALPCLWRHLPGPAAAAGTVRGHSSSGPRSCFKFLILLLLHPLQTFFSLLKWDVLSHSGDSEGLLFLRQDHTGQGQSHHWARWFAASIRFIEPAQWLWSSPGETLLLWGSKWAAKGRNRRQGATECQWISEEFTLGQGKGFELVCFSMKYEAPQGQLVFGYEFVSPCNTLSESTL
jgi:hypothetical protein